MAPPTTAGPHPDELRTVPETCRVLRIGPTKCWELIGNGDLEVVRLGKRCTRVKNSSINRVIQNGVAA